MSRECTCAGPAPGYPQHEHWCGQPEPDDEAEANRESWDCGSGHCDPNTGCPACSDEKRIWTRRS